MEKLVANVVVVGAVKEFMLQGPGELLAQLAEGGGSGPHLLKLFL